jgi:hypothetical protein
MYFLTVLAWMETEWLHLLCYLPICHMLLMGWMGVVFQNKADAEAIFSELYH